MDEPPEGLLPPDSGMRINFATRVPQILIGVTIPFAIASIFVALRLYARALIVRSWGWDDTLVTISWILGLGVTIVASVSTRYGSGYHQDAIPPSSAVPALQLEYANLLLYQACLACLKFSICSFYLRLFSDRKSRFLIISTMIWIACYFVPIELIDIFNCIPIEGIWNKKIVSTCINIHPCFYTMAVCNILGDALLIAIVAPKIWPLKMPRRQKIALMSVITSGWLAIVAAIVRVIRISRSLDSHDRSWTYYDTAIWSGIEISVSLFCVSAPAIKPVLQKYTPGLVASMSQTYSFNNITYNNNGYVKSSDRMGGAQNGTITYVNGASGDISQAEMGFALQELKGGESSANGKAAASNLSRSNSKVVGNRTFWWDKKGGNSSDSDSESLEEIAAKPEPPARDDNPPMMGIMKSTSVTVSVEDSRVKRNPSEGHRRDSLMDRGGRGFSFDHKGMI